MARLVDQLIGNHQVGQRLLRLSEEERLPHAILLSGETGLGKTQWAWAIIQYLSCEARTPQGACGQCYSCRSIEHKNSPFVLSVGPQGDSIKLEQAQEIHHFFEQQRIHRIRAVIIDQAHKLLPTTANKLLKLLEEPPESSYFFLVSPYPWQLLPTIKSRVSEWRFQRVSDDTLRSHFPEAKASHIKAARGRPGVLKTLLAWQNREKDPRQIVWGWLKNKAQQQLQGTEGIRKDLDEESQLTDGLVFWGYHLIRDLNLARAGLWEQVISNDLVNAHSLLPFSSLDLSLWAENWSKLEQKWLQSRDKELALQEFILTGNHPQKKSDTPEER